MERQTESDKQSQAETARRLGALWSLTVVSHERQADLFDYTLLRGKRVLGYAAVPTKLLRSAEEEDPWARW